MNQDIGFNVTPDPKSIFTLCPDLPRGCPGPSVLTVSSVICNPDVLRRLLAAGGNPNVVIDVDGRRPIHAAIDRGHIGMIKVTHIISLI